MLKFGAESAEFRVWRWIWSLALNFKFGAEFEVWRWIRSLALNSKFGAEYTQMKSNTHTASKRSNCTQMLWKIEHLNPGLRWTATECACDPYNSCQHFCTIYACQRVCTICMVCTVCKYCTTCEILDLSIAPHFFLYKYIIIYIQLSISFFYTWAELYTNKYDYVTCYL